MIVQHRTPSGVPAWALTAATMLPCASSAEMIARAERTVAWPTLDTMTDSSPSLVEPQESTCSLVSGFFPTAMPGSGVGDDDGGAGDDVFAAEDFGVPELPSHPATTATKQRNAAIVGNVVHKVRRGFADKPAEVAKESP
jgi:hypothetical protein